MDWKLLQRSPKLTLNYKNNLRNSEERKRQDETKRLRMDETASRPKSTLNYYIDWDWWWPLLMDWKLLQRSPKLTINYKNTLRTS
jgi:hypothetical protein